MEATFQDFTQQLLVMFLTGVLALVGAYLKMYIKAKIDIAKYGFENERVERIIDNAVSYAEQKAKVYLKAHQVKLDSAKKLDFARQYIGKVDKSIVEKFSEELNCMIDRKTLQKFGA